MAVHRAVAGVEIIEWGAVLVRAAGAQRRCDGGVHANVWGSVHANVWGSVHANVWGDVRANAGGHVRDDNILNVGGDRLLLWLLLSGAA